MIKFGEYLPDIAPLENPGLLIAENIIPSSSGYIPCPSPAPFSANAIDSRPSGADSFRSTSDANGKIYTIVGTADKLYNFDASSFTDISRMGGYATADGESWEFAQWGNQVVATNFSDEMQVVDLGSPPFDDLSTDAPKARHLAVIDNFLVVANTWDATDLFQPTRVRWAGRGSITDWVFDPATQADSQDLHNSNGFIQKVVGGEFGLVFQERSITRMSYIGSPLIFQFDEVESERGALAANSVVKVGSSVFYLAQDGFFAFNGQDSIPIGDGKIDQTFFDDVDITLLNRMSVDLYPGENIVVWSYQSTSAPNDMPDTLLFYNYSRDSEVRWAYAKIDNFIILSPISTAYTLDGLDAVSTNIDALPDPPPDDISLDSKVWMGSINLLATINPDLGLSLLNGSPLDSTIITGEAWYDEPQRTQVTLIRPHIDRNTGLITAQIGCRNLESEAVSFGAISTLNSAGYIPVRANARFMRAKFNVIGSYNRAQGFDIISTTPTGRR